eukprot:scaffold62720_cov59-Phaeocystis_antarctica.AAC.4
MLQRSNDRVDNLVAEGVADAPLQVRRRRGRGWRDGWHWCRGVWREAHGLNIGTSGGTAVEQQPYVDTERVRPATLHTSPVCTTPACVAISNVVGASFVRIGRSGGAGGLGDGGGGRQTGNPSKQALGQLSSSLLMSKVELMPLSPHQTGGGTGGLGGGGDGGGGRRLGGMGGACGDGRSGGIMTATVSAASKSRNNIAAVLRPCADDAPIAHPGSLVQG